MAYAFFSSSFSLAYELLLEQVMALRWQLVLFKPTLFISPSWLHQCPSSRGRGRGTFQPLLEGYVVELGALPTLNPCS